MRTLVVLAVMGVCCTASYQASNYGRSGPYGHVQPRWTGPVAATVPAGVDGKIVQVPDTPDVAAARGHFFRAYENQLSTINSLRHSSSYGRPQLPAGHAPTTHGHAPAHVHVPSGPSHASTAAHAPGNTYSHPSTVPHAPRHSYSHGPAVVHTSYTQAAPSVPVVDTPEVAAAKAEFFRTYERQAAEAAAAPDDYVHDAPSYGAPTHSYGRPVVSHAPAHAPVHAPAHSYGPSSVSHAPAHSYGHPSVSHAPAHAPVHSYSAPAAPNVPVTDTPEVAVAKADFFRTFNRQAAEAAAAPDVYTKHH